MKLNVLERLLLGNMLPDNGSFVTLKIVRDLRTTLMFTEEEINTISLRDDGGQVKWELNIEKDFEITPMQIQLIVNALKKLDADETLTEQHMSLCEKFLED